MGDLQSHFSSETMQENWPRENYAQQMCRDKEEVLKITKKKEV